MKDEEFLTPNFRLAEFKCHDGTSVPEEYYPNVKELAKNLQALRDYLTQSYRDLSIVVMSGYRTKSHNEAVKGEDNSRHLLAQAADIKVFYKKEGERKQMPPKEVAESIKELIALKRMKQGGIGIYPTFTHYDVRGTKARW